MSSKVVLYKGRRGCGKTLTMVKDGYNYYKNGWKILRNFNCAFGNYISEEEILKLDKNSRLVNCVIMIDEVQIFFDSRRSMKKEALNFSNFIQQIRKRNIILLGTTQYANTIDLRFRQHTDFIVYPNFIKNLNVCEAIYLDATALESNIDLDLNNQTIIPNQIKIVFDATKVFNLYLTEEMIK